MKEEMDELIQGLKDLKGEDERRAHGGFQTHQNRIRDGRVDPKRHPGPMLEYALSTLRNKCYRLAGYWMSYLIYLIEEADNS